MFDNNFIRSLPEDKAEASNLVSNIFFKKHNSMGKGERIKEFQQYIDAFAFGQLFVQEYEISLGKYELDYSKGKSGRNINIVVNFFQKLLSMAESELTKRNTIKSFEAAKKRYSAVIGKVIFYEFTDDDFSRVQELVNELREVITKSKDFNENHKLRLLKRLEKLQGELHQKMSKLDMFWGLIGDAGVALGKFGTNAKPFTDRIGEILKIVSQTQAKAENMKKPLPLPLLPESNVESEKKES